jgi:putative oxidoreductase
MIPERYAPQTYALMRVVFGFVFLILGLEKWGLLPHGPAGAPPSPLAWTLTGGQAVPVLALIGAAGIIETVCGTLIMIGLFTKPAAFLASGEMAVAYFMIHQGMGLLPNQNFGERAVLFCFAFLYIATRGAGICSVDAAMGSGRRR